MNNMYETFLETEEKISPEEFLKRRESGLVDANDVRFVPPTGAKNDFGSFAVKLNTPRYNVDFSILPSRRDYVF